MEPYNEKIIKLLSSNVCAYNYSAADHTSSGSHRGRGDHSEYIHIAYDSGHHHDHPRTAGICDLPVPFADHDPVPSGHQCVNHPEHPDQFRFFRADH